MQATTSFCRARLFKSYGWLNFLHEIQVVCHRVRAGKVSLKGLFIFRYKP